MLDRALVRSTPLLTLMVLAGCSSNTAAPDVATNPGSDAAVTSPDGAAPAQVTYWRDIAPIVNANCTSCHSPGGIGPMPLTTYDEVRPVAPLLRMETAARRMPPWPPNTENCRPLQHSRSLTQAQIDTIAAWNTAGAPEGNRGDYVAPPAETERLPPEGDVVARMDAPYTPTTTENDDYHCFIMDPHLTSTKDVIGVRVTPGNARIVHHVLLFEVRTEALAELQALDAAEPGPGYTCFGSHRINPRIAAAPPGSGDIVDLNTQMITGWAPGGVPGYFPANTGIRLKAGSLLVMQVHYNLVNPANRQQSDQSRVDLYTSPTGVPSQAIWVPVLNQSFNVPAGAAPTDPAATVIARSQAQFPLRVFGAAPHMHLRGRSIRVDLDHPAGAGDSECLVNLPNYNFHWQQAYWFNTPLRPNSAAGMRDTFRLTCVYDNTAANQPTVGGVQQQPRALTWGEGTDDEMCLNFFYEAL